MDLIQQFLALSTPYQIGTIFVVHLTQAIVCSIIARQRGRRPKLWFYLALVFQIFALACLLLAPARPRSVAVQNPLDNDPPELDPPEQR